MTTLTTPFSTQRRLPWVALVAGVIAAAAAAVTVLNVSPLLAAAGAIGCLVASAILRQPFLGVLLLVGTVQQVGWSRALLPGLIGVTDILTLLTVAGVVFEKRREHTPGRPLPEDLALRMAGLFGLLILLSAVFVDRPGALIRTQKLIGYLVLLFLIVHQTTTTRRARALALALVATTALSCGVAISDHYLRTNLGALGASSADARESGSAGLASNAAKQMATGGALAAMLFLRDRRWRWLTGSTTLLMVAAVPITAGRAAMLTVGLAFAWILAKYRRHPRFGAVLFLVPIIVAASLALIPSHSWERLTKLTDPAEDTTTVLRLAMYKMGFEFFKDNPLLGLGVGQFERDWLEFENRWSRPTDEPYLLHNAYLGVLVDFGIFALMAFLTLLWVTWRSLHWAVNHAPEPEQRCLAEAMEVALVLYLIQANTGPGQWQLFMWLVVAISLAVARVARASARGAPTTLPPPRSAGYRSQAAPAQPA